MKKNLKKITSFTKELISEINNDDLFSAANDLTYKIFFSVFPFTIFLMSIVGFLNLDGELIIKELFSVLPYAVNKQAEEIIREIISVKNANILSFSLVVSVYSASSGFNTVMRCINKTYGQKDSRKIYAKILISMALVIIFTVIIIASFALLIFGDNILNFIKDYFNFHNDFLFYLFDFLRYIISLIIMFYSVILINKLSLNKKTSVKKLIPGAVFTVVSWFIIISLFNLYIENFSNYKSVYGSITGIIILMIWLNIMCLVILLGSEINSTLEDF